MKNCPLLTETLLWLRDLRNQLLRQKNLTYLLVSTAAVTLTFGTAFYIVDPNVKSPLDGMWYAWVTMTHVGYGDVVVTSFLGRVLASLLILFGIALLALCTATLIGHDTDQLGREMRLLEKDANRIEVEENLVLRELARIQEKLARIEEQLKIQE